MGVPPLIWLIERLSLANFMSFVHSGQRQFWRNSISKENTLVSVSATDTSNADITSAVCEVKVKRSFLLWNCIAFCWGTQSTVWECNQLQRRECTQTFELQCQKLFSLVHNWEEWSQMSRFDESVQRCVGGLKGCLELMQVHWCHLPTANIHPLYYARKMKKMKKIKMFSANFDCIACLMIIRS